MNDACEAMDKLERFAYWKQVAVDALRAARSPDVADFEEIIFKNEDQLFGYFECFRPYGDGVERVFSGINGGEEIVERLQKVYQCTKDGSGAYFIVRRPAPASSEKLVALTRQHLEKMRQIAQSFDDAWLVSELDRISDIKVMRKAISQQTRSDLNAPEGVIYEVTGDWFRGLDPIPSDALLLNEAFYSIACDYKIARYLLWPLYKRSTEIDDPFAPYLELWTLGALPFFEKPGLVNVYVAGES